MILNNEISPKLSFKYHVQATVATDCNEFKKKKEDF